MPSLALLFACTLWNKVEIEIQPEGIQLKEIPSVFLGGLSAIFFPSRSADWQQHVFLWTVWKENTFSAGNRELFPHVSYSL